jgi:transcriptional regulator with XRE-family HTH domain
MRIGKAKKTTLYNRLQYLLQYWGIKESEFIKETKLESAEIRKMIKDEDYISEAVAKAVTQYDANINRDWFLFNEGKMMIIDQQRDADDYTDINQRVKELRLKNSLNQQDMASILGCARSTYANIEQNNQTLSFKYIRLLRKRFNVPYDFLLDGVEEEASDSEKNQMRVGYLEEQVALLKKSNDALVSAIQQLTSA